VAAFFAGAVMMLCGAVSVRVLAGQLTVLSAACWTPLVLLVVDRLLARPALGWSLLGIAAITLQILAGYPFYVFVAAMLVALQACVSLARCEQRARALVALASLALAPPLLAAAQLWPGLATAAESLRSGGTPFWFASSFSLPPESLLTAFAPAFFGDTPNNEYWGKTKYWDAAVFLGVTTLVLALHGALRGDPKQRRFASLFAALMLILALGKHTPVYRPLLEWVPGFESFRAPSKFALHASLFVALLAGVGLDRWLRASRGARPAALATGFAALALVLAGLWLRAEARSGPAAGRWGGLASAWANPDRVPQAELLLSTADAAAAALWTAAATAALVALLLALLPRIRWVPCALALLGIGEVALFAQRHHDRFRLEETRRPELEAFYREHPGDHRVFDPFARNHAVLVGAHSVWGYDPVQLDRYARFVASTQVGGPLSPDFNLPLMVYPKVYHPLLGLVRCRYLISDALPPSPPLEVEGALPRFLLVRGYRVVSRPETLLGLFRPGFDPREKVLLEEEPGIEPGWGEARGRAVLVDESTDHLLIDVELESPAILVVTDAYSEGWRATALSSDPPREIPVLAVDHALRGIALPSGQHRVLLEYAPSAYRHGVRLSLASLLLFLAATALWARRRLERALR
jgi:hypothetical protein